MNLIQQDADDTFKIDEQASVPMQQQRHQSQQLQSQQKSTQDMQQPPVTVIDDEEEEQNQDQMNDGPDRRQYINSMVSKQENLLKQIRELEAQIQKDQENIDEQNEFIRSAQKMQNQR